MKCSKEHPKSQPPRTKSGELPPARPVQLASLVDYTPGSIVSRTVAQSEAGTLTLFAVSAGQNMSEHTAPFDAFLQILDGEAELTIGGKRVVASAGDTVLMPADVPHAVRAGRDFKMLLTMIRGKPARE